MAGAHFRRLARLFAQYRSKAEGCLELLFFGTSQRATGAVFCRELTKSRRQSGAALFRVIAAGRRIDFSKRIDPKPEAVWSCTFSGHRSELLGESRGRCGKAAGGCLAGTSFRGTFPDAGETFRRVSTQSRRLSGGNIFSGYISKGWSGFLLSIDPKPEAVRSCTFSGYRNGPLGEPRDRWEKAAGGCLAGTSFRGTFPDAGETFCRELTKSRKLSGGNIFSGYISERWRDFLLSIDLKPKAVWREYFFEVHFRRLAGPFVGD